MKIKRGNWMRTLFVVIVMLLSMMVVNASAFEPRESITKSSNQTASASVVAGAGYLYKIVLATDGSNAVTIDGVYDSLTATGTRLLPDNYEVTTSATDRTHTISFESSPVQFSTGVYVDVSTAGALDYMVYYRDK